MKCSGRHHVVHLQLEFTNHYLPPKKAATLVLSGVICPHFRPPILPLYAAVTDVPAFMRKTNANLEQED